MTVLAIFSFRFILNDSHPVGFRALLLGPGTVLNMLFHLAAGTSSSRRSVRRVPRDRRLPPEPATRGAVSPCQRSNMSSTRYSAAIISFLASLQKIGQKSSFWLAPKAWLAGQPSNLLSWSPSPQLASTSAASLHIEFGPILESSEVYFNGNIPFF
jgi:hypothetical protein